MRTRFGAPLGILALALAACGSQPVGLTAQAGSTFGLAITGEVAEGDKLGFGAVYAGTPLYDDQRGELLFVLRTPGGGSEYPLQTRLVTRVFPDPASDAGLTGSLDSGWAFGIAQPLALIDVPASVPPATYDIEVRRRRRTSPTGWETFPTGSGSPFDQPRQITVLPASSNGVTGAPTPFEGMLGPSTNPDTAAYAPTLYPHPKLVVNLGAPPPAAARLRVDYPQAKMQVQGVIEEQHYGRSSIIAYDDDPQSGELTIDFVDPTASVERLAIVFEPIDPFGAGRVSAPSDFGLLAGSQLYDADGNAIATSVTFGPIR
jgi:hypothetical protein